MRCKKDERLVNMENRDSRKLGLRHRDTAAAPAAIRYLRQHRQATQLQQHFAETVAFFEVHIDKFKCHRLRPSAADNRLRLDVANTVRKLQARQRTGREVSFS